MRERWMAMPPAARQNFQRNAERWLRMSPAERNVLLSRKRLPTKQENEVCEKCSMERAEGLIVQRLA